jgi:hypothetical protein
MKRWTALAGLAMLGAAATANAAVSDEQFQQMQQKLDQALGRINELEKEGAATGAAQQAEIDALAAAAAASEASKTALVDQVAANTAKIDTTMSWADRIRIEGDFRYRYQNDDAGSPVNESRNRNRIRARPAIIAMLDPKLEVGFGLATGDNSDPVSSNQTLGNAGSDKDVTIDLAYFNWTGVQDTSIRGGKFKNTFQIVGGSQLQWDSDWRPEGGDVTWNNGTFFAQGGGIYLESDSRSNNTEFAYILQTGATGTLGPVTLTGGVGYTDIDAAGKPCYFNQSSAVPSASGLCQGNQATVVTNPGPPVVNTSFYANDFQVYDVFAQAGLKVAGLPLSFFADYINNSDADDYEQGYLIGTQLGSLKVKGEWQIGYYYEDLESNATLGLLTNSDFGGGGTNGKGSVFNAGYALSDKTNIQATYYLVDRNSDKIATINNGDDISVDTLQLDLNFKYK